MSFNNTQLILKQKPGSDFPQNVNIFEIKKSEVPELKDGQFLIKVYFLSIDPIMRVWMTGAPTYLPTLKPGQVMHSYGVGEVVQTKNDSWRVGDKCVTNSGIQDYCVMDEQRQMFCFKIPHKTPLDKLAFYLPLLNNWFVAYQGIVVDGKTKKGETVVVSSAAGATGIVCVQLAKLAGARVVAIAGGEKKCRFLKEQLGADETIDYKDTNQTFFQKLKKACPKGVDVYFDNVGDEMLDDVLKITNLHGRISLCGATSNYSDHKNRKGISNYQVAISRRIFIKGVLASEIGPIADKVVPEMLQHVNSGAMKSIEVYFNGVESVPQAMQYCFLGQNVGKVMIKLQAASNINSTTSTVPKL
ncbi:hypothetical protein ABPG74_016364 [Tetrahymena malaccensis]